ncbi:hypothetical protein [Flavobacterium sp. GSP14]|uniref:hypothetical protein n=1 Tax=Flavobacterium sp. GSP14 TaxID=3401734 RepID=UPI003AAC0398
MKKIYLLVLAFISFFVSSQNNNQEINSLIDKINKHNGKILSLKDSVKLIELEIQKIKSKKVLTLSKSSQLSAIAVKDGSLKKLPLLGSDEIFTLSSDTEILVTDYVNGYYKVCINSICGFMNEVWLKSNREIDNLKEIRTIEKENILALKEQQRIIQQKKISQEQEIKNIKKYGKMLYEKLKQGYYWIGMTNKMALISLGNPNDINKTVGSWGTHEQWVFDDGFYCYFENGILTSYQN